MKKLKSLRAPLAIIWFISIVARIISKTTDLFEIATWFMQITVFIIFTVIGLSIFIYVNERKNKHNQ